MHGGFGLLAREGVRKPAYFAHKYLDALKGLEVPSAEKATNRTFFGRPIPASPARPLELVLRKLHALTADTAEVNRRVKLRADAPLTVPVTMRSNDVVLVTLAPGAKPQPKTRPKAKPRR